MQILKNYICYITSYCIITYNIQFIRFHVFLAIYFKTTFKTACTCFEHTFAVKI